MNKRRRKEIYAVITRLNGLTQENDVEKIHELLADIIEDIDLILNDEECYKDNIPENLQNGSRYEESEYSCDCLQDAISELEYVEDEEEKECIVSAINSAVNYLNDAT